MASLLLIKSIPNLFALIRTSQPQLTHPSASSPEPHYLLEVQGLFSLMTPSFRIDPTGIHVGSYEVGMALQSCPTLRRGKWGFEALYSDIVIMLYFWVWASLGREHSIKWSNSQKLRQFPSVLSRHLNNIAQHPQQHHSFERIMTGVRVKAQIYIVGALHWHPGFWGLISLCMSVCVW